MIQAKVTLQAVHDNDLVKILKRLNMYECVVEGKCRCFACNREITLDNLGGLFKKNGKIHLVCNNIRCLLIAAEITSSVHSER